MNKFMSEYRRLMLIQTAEGGTLAEEVISSVRNTHAFGTQKKLTDMYDVSNQKVNSTSSSFLLSVSLTLTLRSLSVDPRSWT